MLTTAIKKFVAAQVNKKDCHWREENKYNDELFVEDRLVFKPSSIVECIFSVPITSVFAFDSQTFEKSITFDKNR